MSTLGVTTMALGYTDYEEGYRHGKRDFAVGLRSPTLLRESGNYAKGYRDALRSQENYYRQWIEHEISQ